MRLCVISFTEKGIVLSEKTAEILKEISGETACKTVPLALKVDLYTKCQACRINAVYSSVKFVTTSLGEWTRTQMEEKNALLFIGACGIAVRAIAPYLADKLHDAPVLVMDEQGRYVIPVLAGHTGGANELACYIAEKTGAKPVITTATDLNKKFAVDLFAKKNGLSVENRDGIAKVSAKVLAGEEITIAIEQGHGISMGKSEVRMEKPGKWKEIGLPEGVRLVSCPLAEFVDVAISSQKEASGAALVLRPREYVIGMGCRRGKSTEEIDRFIEEKLAGLGISDMQIYALASISQKSHEPGLTAWCQRKGVLFLTYTAEELQEVEGEFQKSAFVKEQVGVDNVCERAAVKACGHNGKLISRKYAENGMTIAVSRREWKIEF